MLRDKTERKKQIKKKKAIRKMMTESRKKIKKNVEGQY
jgi:hypothetical protein